MENSPMNTPPNSIVNRSATLFNRAETIGIGIHGAVGGISALVTLLLLFHLFMVAAVRRGKAGKVNGEKVFVLTRLGAYFACLLISDLLISFGQFIQALWASLGGINEGPLCTTQALLIQIGGYGTAVFSSVIAIHTFSVIALQKTSPKCVAICVIVLGWALPIAASLIAIFSHPGAAPFYGLAQNWCWIRPEYPTQRVFLHYLPILLSTFISLVCYSLLFFVVRGNLHIDGARVTLRSGWQGQMESNEDYMDMLSVLANRMLWYPISYIVLIMPMTVVRLLSATRHTVPFAAWVVAGIALASLGFVNVVIYCMTRAILGRPPTTTWDTGSESTLVIATPSSAVEAEHLPNRSKLDDNGSTSNYDGQAPVVPLYMYQPPPTSYHPYPAVPQPVVHTLPRNSPPQLRRGDSDATMVAQRTYGHPSRNSSYSSTRSGSTAAPAPLSRSFVPERIINPELLQRPITPPSDLALQMEKPRSASLNQQRSRIASDDTLRRTGSLAPPPRPVASHSPSTSIGPRSERGIKGTGGEQFVDYRQPSSWKGPSHGAPLSAVLGPQDAPLVPPTPTQRAQRSPYSTESPFVAGHYRTRSKPGFL